MTATVTQIKQPAKRPWQQINHDPDDIKKARKKLGQEAIDEIEAANEEQLRAYLVALANHHEVTVQAKARDPDIIRIKAELKAANERYSGTLEGLKLRRLLTTHQLEKKFT